MKLVTISSARRFSLDKVQRSELITQGAVRFELLCFEAGQADDQSGGGHTVYQVLEGEALVRIAGKTERLGKGKLLGTAAGEAHRIENAGGGLLVVLAASAG